MNSWKIRSYFFTFCFYAYFAVWGLSFTCFVAPFVFVLRWFTPRVNMITFAISSVFFSGLTQMLERVGAISIKEFSGKEHLYTHSPCIYVSNHRSILEVLLYLNYIPRTNCLMKAGPRARKMLSYEETRQERRRMPGWWAPFISVSFYFLNYIPMPSEKTDRAGLKTTIEKCRESLQNRRSVMIFPEGTRSKTGRLLPFQMLAFKMAVEEQVPIIPIVVHNREPIMSKGKAYIDIQECAEFRIRVFPPIKPDGEVDAQTLLLKTRRILSKQLIAFNKDHGEFRQQ